MSNDAIHDILEQTESDPAFQALFDLFDTSKYYDLLSLFYLLYRGLQSPLTAIDSHFLPHVCIYR